MWRRLKKKVKPHYCRLQQWTSRGLYAVDLHAPIGFFAQLTDCLAVFAHCEQHDLRPCIILSGASYLSPERSASWFDYFFEQPVLRDADRKRIAAGRIAVSRAWWPSELGIHFRGTDKTSEAPRVEKGAVRRAVLAYLSDHPETNTLYLANDEEPFITWCHEVFGSVPVITHADRYRSHDDRSIHEGLKGDNARKGWEALVNSLLLSRCAALIRTKSFLSAWSSVFTPTLPVVLLNKPHADKLWFPESDIIRRSMDQYGDHR